MKTTVLHGALILMLVAMSAAPILCASCLPQSDCPTADGHPDKAEHRMADETSSMSADHCGQATKKALPQPPESPSGESLRNCCDSLTSSPILALVASSQTSSIQSQGNTIQSTEPVRLALSIDSGRTLLAKRPPRQPEPPLFTLNSSLLL